MQSRASTARLKNLKSRDREKGTDQATTPKLGGNNNGEMGRKASPEQGGAFQEGTYYSLRREKKVLKISSKLGSKKKIEGSSGPGREEPRIGCGVSGRQGMASSRDVRTFIDPGRGGLRCDERDYNSSAGTIDRKKDLESRDTLGRRGARHSRQSGGIVCFAA